MAIYDEDLDAPSQINIVPMIDVIFAILTFFIMATLFLTRSEGLPVNLPNAETATQQNAKQKKVTITIDDKGKLFLDRKPIAVKDLKTLVQSAKGQSAKILVVINADKTVEHGQVIEVMDQRPQKGAIAALSAQIVSTAKISHLE